MTTDENFPLLFYYSQKVLTNPVKRTLTDRCIHI